MFIVFEGLDRSGKTTQAELLAQHLTMLGYRVTKLAFPDRSTPTGKLCDQYLKGELDADEHVMHLLFSANRYEKQQLIIDLLEQQHVVLCDRYWMSGAAYSSAYGLPMKWCTAVDELLVKPHLTIFLDVNPSASIQRSNLSTNRAIERTERQAVQQGVQTAYKNLLPNCPAIYFDGNLPVEDLALQIRQAVVKSLFTPQ